MHTPDLSNNCYLASGDTLRAIGWLEAGHRFSVGEAPRDFVAALRSHLADPFGLMDFCGNHQCSLCPSGSGPFGNGELIIPSDTYCYVAPVLVGHYVEQHGYLPPDQFISAVMQSPPQQSAQYFSLLEPFVPALTGGPNNSFKPKPLRGSA